MNNTGGLYRLLEWIVRLVYVNILWIIFILIGLVVAGFAPATAALFAIIRKWLNGNSDIAIFSYFTRTFKESFFQSNVLFYLTAGFGYSLYFYGQIIQSFDGLIYAGLYTIWLSVILIYLVVSLYLFPVYVHFDLKIFNYFKYALLIGMTSPKQTILIIINTAAISFLFYIVPTFLPFFFGSIISFTIMWIALQAFKKLEGKKGWKSTSIKTNTVSTQKRTGSGSFLC